MIYVFIGNVVQHICNIYNICLMPLPFYGEKMEINYGNGFLFGVRLLRRRGRLKKVLIILHSPPKLIFMNYYDKCINLYIVGVRSLRWNGILVWGVLGELVIYHGSILAWLIVCCDAGSLFIFGKS